MHEVSSWYVEVLASHVTALEGISDALRVQSPAAIESARRIARALRTSSEVYGFPEMMRLSEETENAAATELFARVEKVRETLTELRKGASRVQTTILVVDDSRVQRLKLGQGLCSVNREIIYASSGGEAESILKERPVALIVLDLMLPDMDGRTFLMRLRENPRTSDMPVVIHSSMSQVSVKTECYALGADLFFTKPCHPMLLSTAVSSKLERAGKQAQRAMQDPLTGLPNRAAFNDAFARTSQLAQRWNEPLSTAIIDLDKFKSVNDTYGHAMGDEVIRRAAYRITESIRKSDFLARWGGEEFVALFPRTDVNGAVKTLNNALESLRQEVFEVDTGVSFKVTFSAGASGVALGQMSAEVAVAEADRYLYQAKAAGRNRVLSPLSQVKSPSEPRPRVLLVEHAQPLVPGLQPHLESEGFEVLRVTDTEAAVAAAKRTDLAAILLDMELQAMENFHLLLRVRSVMPNPLLPVALLSFMATEADLRRTGRLGSRDLVFKKYPQDVSAGLKAALARNTGRITPKK